MEAHTWTDRRNFDQLEGFDPSICFFSRGEDPTDPSNRKSRNFVTRAGFFVVRILAGQIGRRRQEAAAAGPGAGVVQIPVVVIPHGLGFGRTGPTRASRALASFGAPFSGAEVPRFFECQVSETTRKKQV